MTIVSNAKIHLGELLYRMTAFIQRHAAWIVILGVALAAALLAYSAAYLGVSTNTKEMFSEELQWVQDFNRYRDEFRELDENLLVVIDADVSENADQAQRLLAERLQSHPERFGTVVALESSDFFYRNGLLFLSMEDLQTLGDRLASMQPVIGRLNQQPHLAGFLSLLVDYLGSESSATDEFDQTMTRLTRAFTEAAGGEPRPVSWQTLLDEENTGAGPYRRVILVAPELQFEGAEPRRQVIRGIREQAADLGLTSDRGVSVRLTGSLALQQEELESVSQGIVQGALLTLALVVGILLLTYRSLRLFTATLIALLSGLALTAAFATFAIGHLNLFSVAFAVLYIGLGVDFSIHYCLRYRELLAEGHDHEMSLRESSRDIGVSLVLCAVTSSVGFFAFVPTQFSGVAELGLISGFGMFASLGVTLILLPALIQLLGAPRNAMRPRVPALVAASGEFSSRHIVLVRSSVGILAVVALLLGLNARFDSNPLNLRDPDSESVTAYFDLLHDPDTAPLTLSVVVDPERVDDLTSQLVDLATVKEVRSIDVFVPERQQDKLALLDDLALVMGSPQPIELAPPETGRDVTAVRELAPQLAQSRRKVERELGEAMQGWIESLDDRDPARALEGLNEAVLSLFPVSWNRIAEGFEARPFSVSELPGTLRNLWFTRDGGRRLEIIPAEPLTDMEQIAAFVESVEAEVGGISGLPAVQYHSGRTVVAAFLQAIVTAVVCVMILLLLLLRNLRRAFAVIVPLLLATGLTAGSTVLLNVPFNFANIITLPLLIGIGVDNGIHMVHRHHNSGGGHAELVSSSTARAILFSTLTTIASFGTLAFSQHPGTASMGILLTVGMVISLITALYVVPAMLPASAKFRDI